MAQPASIEVADIHAGFELFNRNFLDHGNL
jgi:hypothetical protein